MMFLLPSYNWLFLFIISFDIVIFTFSCLFFFADIKSVFIYALSDLLSAFKDWIPETRHVELSTKWPPVSWSVCYTVVLLPLLKF